MFITPLANRTSGNELWVCRQQVAFALGRTVVEVLIDTQYRHDRIYRMLPVYVVLAPKQMRKNSMKHDQNM